MDRLIVIAKVAPLVVAAFFLMWWLYTSGTRGYRLMDRWVALNLKWERSGSGLGYVFVRGQLVFGRAMLFLIYWFCRGIAFVIDKTVVVLLAIYRAVYFSAARAREHLLLTSPDYVELTPEEKEIVRKLKQQLDDLRTEQQQNSGAINATFAELDFYLLSKRRS